MRPIDFKTDLKHIIENRPLLLLNKRLFAVRYVKQLLALGTTTLSTKNALPNELWNMIFELVLADGQDEFCWVQAVAATDKLLHCREVSFSGKKCGEYISTEEVDSFESFMSKTFQGSNDPNGELKVRHQAKFSLPLPSNDEAFLFLEIQVVDVIRHLEGGNCSLCENRRLWSSEDSINPNFDLHNS
jgi:hypothetical protein